MYNCAVWKLLLYCLYSERGKCRRVTSCGRRIARRRVRLNVLGKSTPGFSALNHWSADPSRRVELCPSSALVRIPRNGAVRASACTRYTNPCALRCGSGVWRHIVWLGALRRTSSFFLLSHHDLSSWRSSKCCYLCCCWWVERFSLSQMRWLWVNK